MKRIKIKCREEYLTVFLAGVSFGAILMFLFMAIVRFFFW